MRETTARDCGHRLTVWAVAAARPRHRRPRRAARPASRRRAERRAPLAGRGAGGRDVLDIRRPPRRVVAEAGRRLERGEPGPADHPQLFGHRVHRRCTTTWPPPSLPAPGAPNIVDIEIGKFANFTKGDDSPARHDGRGRAVPRRPRRDAHGAIQRRRQELRGRLPPRRRPRLLQQGDPRRRGRRLRRHQDVGRLHRGRQEGPGGQGRTSTLPRSTSPASSRSGA